MLALQCGALRLGLLPELGGAIATFQQGDDDILRRTPMGARDVIETACFPLVPFVNRIAFGRFFWRGRAVQLKPNFGDHPHVLHGQGWRSVWAVVAQDVASATLALDYQPGDWPWPYRAELTYRLSDIALEAELRLTNRAGEDMPYSLGFHPFFPDRRDVTLRAAVREVWRNDDTQLPRLRADGDFFLSLERGAALADAPFVDNCHTGWRPPAQLISPRQAVSLDGCEQMRFLQIFLPEGKPFFAVEPMTAMPDMVNRPEPPAVTGLRVLAPGASDAVRMAIAIAAAE